ncbi:hypothetical protein S1OALGB6SA_810 [Olavius algarvensis spirochete endosymbiont]|uniref:energy transducer TonB n=1 Tax=Olavius algarvensis spirochete endosymbiont TaxID=260710 RepID=UPI000F189FCC|nr:energy transducer TonB [Olavius algarvensis spirochete endosymbiont]CAD7839252.1 MAG: hypothetical protein [Olavius algarvensis spirochete endosymbiont]VDA99737.1 hypothetical protein S1OALGB6SA_810 [Olavius algarvensis spirochete endosymbiont]
MSLMLSRSLMIATTLSLGLHSILFFAVFFWTDDFPGSTRIEGSSSLTIRLTNLDSDAGFKKFANPTNPHFPNTSSESNPSPNPSVPEFSASSSAQVSPTLSAPTAASVFPSRQLDSAFPASLPGSDTPSSASQANPSFLPAAPHSIPKPNYPLFARRQGIEGIVLIELDIDAAGALASFKFISPRSNSLLEQSVLASLENLSFVPAISDGRFVQSTLLLKFRFELED